MPKLWQPKPKRLRSAWDSGYKSLPTLDGKRHRKPTNLTIPILDFGHKLQTDVTEDDVNDLARVIHDDNLAKRIRKLQHSKYPYGTVPELLMLDYLDSQGERYKYQAQLFGGFRSGGLVPDFVVSRGGGWRAINIQGQYWHQVPGKMVKDAADKLRMIGAPYEGQTIVDVIFVWERRIMQPNPGRDQVLQNAVAGIEMGP